MSDRDREAIRWLLILGLVLANLLLINPGVGLFLTFALILWLYGHIAKAEESKQAKDAKWWRDDK